MSAEANPLPDVGPFLPELARLFAFIFRGRLLEVRGYYFSEMLMAAWGG
jgi:hypothetical protein